MAVLPVSSADNDAPADSSLIAMLLAEQNSLTAVEKFSAFHDASSHTAEPAQAQYYRDLLPAGPPRPGTQYAFRVDLDACSGCKACVVACHTMNGLEERESWRRVGTLTVHDGDHARLQHVTTACHHCADPGCLSGCPVKAYDKDPETGIVRHLDDQCIGCKYCTMMCPYEVPRYSERLGIVRKCDMCHQRLSNGEAPACVQSCPNSAIAIDVVSTDPKHGRDDRLASGAPLSSITRPTTVYRSEHLSNMQAAIPQDRGIDHVAESHWPLAAMLVATQAAVGTLLAERLTATTWPSSGALTAQWAAVVTLMLTVIGMGIAPLHLGQPLRAWKVFLGIRTSWLSREAIVLGAFSGALTVATALLWLPSFESYVPSSVSQWIPSWLAIAAVNASVVLGLLGLFSSAMIYIATQRSLWRATRTLPLFFGSMAVAGTCCVSAVLLATDSGPQAIRTVLIAGIVVALIKLASELRWSYGPLSYCSDDHVRRSRRLLHEPLRNTLGLRFALGLSSVSGLCLSLVLSELSIASVSLGFAVAATLTAISGEFCERLLYFMSVVYDRMPGTLS